MPTQLTRFKIEGLHNLRTVDIPIEDNRLVLVGENGTGKSTVANLIYYFLTFQWSRMLEAKFRSVSATVNGKEYYFAYKDIQIFARDAHRSTQIMKKNRFPKEIRDRLQDVFDSYSISEIEENFDSIARNTGLPSRFFKSEFHRFKELSESDAYNLLESLKNSVIGQTLYLPTYRRIEQDLHQILRGVDDKEIQRQLRERTRGKKFVELVQFGMDDVKYTIDEKTNALEKQVGDDLNKLTGEYLKDAIRGSYRNASFDDLQGLDRPVDEDKDREEIDNVLDRIPNEILPLEDKKTLRRIVTAVNSGEEVAENDRVGAHFLTKLVQLYNKQKASEQDLRNFEEVCNRYLTGKRLKYDNVSFSVEVFEENSPIPIPYKGLSSGEKQIVSLFSHLYLSGNQNYFVIIDEPELSLSVPWQRIFLPDILKSCNGLIAVTHSPFVYDNELKPYVHALDEFIVPFERSPELDEEQDATDESVFFIGDD